MDTEFTTTAINFLNTTTYRKPFGETDTLYATILLLTFMVLGIIGNGLTITVILKSPKLRNVFNHFILSLCCSDLISSCISWICLYRRTWGFDDFNIHNFFCIIYWGGDIWTSFVTAQHIACFAFLRLLSIWKPIVFNKIRLSHAKIWIACMWSVSFMCGFIPLSIFSGARKRDRTIASPVSRWPACTQNEEWLEGYSLYAKIGYSIFFYIPCAIVFATTIFIIVVMTRRRRPSTNCGIAATPCKTAKRQAKEKQAILQLLLIVGSFCIGYMPFTVYEFYTLGSRDTSFMAWRKDWLIGMWQYICLRFSECVNPVFYNLASSKMRKHTKLFLEKLCGTVFCCSTIDESEKQKSQSSSTNNPLQI